MTIENNAKLKVVFYLLFCWKASVLHVFYLQGFKCPSQLAVFCSALKNRGPLETNMWAINIFSKQKLYL